MAEPTSKSGGQSAQPASKSARVSEADLKTNYANFCRVTGTPEELVIDFGLNAQPVANAERPIEIDQRVVLNYYSAKRLLNALGVAVQRHEELFGTLETEVSKRLKKRPQDGGKKRN